MCDYKIGKIVGVYLSHLQLQSSVHFQSAFMHDHLAPPQPFLLLQQHLAQCMLEMMVVV